MDMTLSIGNKEIKGEYKVIIPNISFEEFLEFADEDISCELLDGVLVINSPVGYTHETIFRFLITYLSIIGKEINLGTVIGSRFIVKLDEKWGPEPDLIFYRYDKEILITETYFDGTPDIIVEILSPTNRDDDLEKKLPRYLKFKVPEIWIIDPSEKTLIIHSPEENPKKFEGDEMVESLQFSDIKFKLNWLWDSNVNTIACLKEIGIL